jgi:hypothetical protein
VRRLVPGDELGNPVTNLLNASLQHFVRPGVCVAMTGL